MDLSLPAILKKLEAFRKTEWFNVLLLVVLGFVAVGLFEFTAFGSVGVCLGILLPPVTVFVIPYWLGERRMKRYALNILPVAVVALLVISAFQTQAVLSQEPPNLGTTGVDPATPTSSLPPLTVWNGSVVPFDTPSPNGTYAFHVRLKAASGVNVSRVSVYLNLTDAAGLSITFRSAPMGVDPGPVNANRTNGTWYVAWQKLGTDVYEIYYFANDTRGNSTASDIAVAPLLAPWGSYYILWVEIVLERYITFFVAFYFVILFMYWYTVRTRKMRERLIQARGEKLDLKKGGGKEAEEGGTDKGAAAAEAPAPTHDKTKKATAFTCTNCGADVTEDDAKCPKCGAVFED